MISVQKRFLFVHIPRTGGNSMQSILKDYSEDEIVRSRERQDGVERFGLKSFYPGLKKHSTLAEYRIALGEGEFGTLYKFSCARNPWDRMISYYFGTGSHPLAWDREAFAELINTIPSAADYVHLGDEADPFANLNRILRFENLGEDFRALCGELRIPPTPLPAYNRSSRDDYKKYYDTELREMVAARCAPEIARFGYTF